MSQCSHVPKTNAELSLSCGHWGELTLPSENEQRHRQTGLGRLRNDWFEPRN
jgi:hypothetical protein